MARRRPSSPPAATITTSFEHVGKRRRKSATAGIDRAVPRRDSLPDAGRVADALRRLLAAGIELDGASDHGVSEALYLRDPDENGVELYWDRPEHEWPRAADGGVAMFTRRLDVEDLLREAQ